MESRIEPFSEPHRLEKLRELSSLGLDPFGHRFTGITHHASEIVEHCDALLGGAVRIAGRVRAVRLHGGSCFLDLHDESGRIQVYVRKDAVGEEAFHLLDFLDLGDFLGVDGTVFRTRRGEPSVDATEITPLSKALRPPPEKYHGLQDTELRYRYRYLDLMANPEVRRTFRQRSAIIQAFRRTLDERGFLEVETPVLHHQATGAAARPFGTHHNTLDLDLNLRIALELHLKRLLVGGFERVYEIGRVFRNEGISTRHNPEYTLMECYQAYGDREDMMDLTEALVRESALAALGQTRFTYRGEEFDAGQPWHRVTFAQAIRDHGGPDVDALRTEDDWRHAARETGVDPGQPIAKLMDDLFEHYAQPHLRQPTFVLDHPAAMSPLARAAADPRYALRFEPMIAGMEIGNAYTEQNSPLAQRAAFEQQARERQRGDEEAHGMDEDFLFALEHGMPPTGGLGIGVDRLCMLLLDASSLREVILFPLQRPRA
ncbi:MAG: lysine--tRNA ligase [Thermaerobacter sp.]|nr:lysine--tRNA ligase [Thermaerobacter sp.]